jgi:hypothetical protein
MKPQIANPKLKKDEELKSVINRLMQSDDGRVLLSYIREITGWDKPFIVKGIDGVLVNETLELSAKKEVFKEIISYLNREYYYLVLEKES